MTHSNPIEHLHEALRALAGWMGESKVPHCVIGGVAVSLYVRARFTEDVDATVLIEPEQWSSFLERGEGFGLVPRIAEPLRFAQISRVLLMEHRPSGIPIDVSFAGLPFEEEVIRRATVKQLGDVSVTLPTIGDLIVMKAVAGRPVDWADIDSLMGANPRVSLAPIRKNLRTMCQMLESSDIIERFESFVAERRKRKGR